MGLGFIGAYRQNNTPGDRERRLLDHQEAEAYRQYAHHQAIAGRFGIAITNYLNRAINLHPQRGLLYLERARYAMDQFGLRLEENGLPTDRARMQAQQVLEDCQAAIACNDSLAGAYTLGVKILFALGNIEKVKQMASRGEKAVRDKRVAAQLAGDRQF